MVAELTCSSCLPGAVGTIFLETFGKLRRWKLCLVCEKGLLHAGTVFFFHELDLRCEVAGEFWAAKHLSDSCI